MANDLHVEWEDHATDVAIEVLDQDDALEKLQPDDECVYGEWTLVLSSGGGGAFATSGTREELLNLAQKIHWAVREATH